MSRVHVQPFKGKSVILIDLSNAKVDEISLTLSEASGTISKQGPKNARVLTDVTNATYTPQVAQMIKQFTATNTPFIHASAVVGVEGVRYVLLQTVNMLTRRDIKIFPTRDQAKEWLTNN